MKTQTQFLTAMMLLTMLALTACSPISQTPKTLTTPATTSSTWIKPPGPEADPYLRHYPGSYDYENELPPIELPFQ